MTLPKKYGEYAILSVKKCLAAPKRQSQVTVHPNPTDGRLKIESGELKIEKAEMFDIFGIKVFETTETTFGIGHLPQGGYIIKICPENNDIVTWKIVKQ
ncbi:MAG: T9SS type A sorting domain-containing protein [Bacteroidales bacterium]|jgi:hypothetical protein|nr:T9SS type A sorting domain-containing protein [Bacteroidales bacterium]